jgi:predicted phosphodiesterase
MSDQKGDRDTKIWAAINRDKDDLTRFFSVIIHGGRLRRTTDMLQLYPQERLKKTLKKTLTGLERKARSTVQPVEVLIFGDTHRPFMNKAENLINTGSWITTDSIHNTFVRLESGKPRLFVFEGDEITERADI